MPSADIRLQSILIHARWTLDVYSYAEDDMVVDPHLEKHLKHFGIDLKNLTKVSNPCAHPVSSILHFFLLFLNHMILTFARSLDGQDHDRVGD